MYSFDGAGTGMSSLAMMMGWMNGWMGGQGNVSFSFLSVVEYGLIWSDLKEYVDSRSNLNE
jgi:hypothetical protein